MPKSLAAAALACALAAGCAPRAVLTDPIVTDRPDFTESVETVPRGWVQVEGGYTASRGDGVTEHTAGELLLRAGLAERVELRVGLPSYTVAGRGDARVTGLGDASLGAKVALWGGDSLRAWAPRTSLIVATSLPTGHRDLRAPAAVPEAKLALGWDVGERASFASNLNAALPREAGARHAELSASGSLGVALGARAGAYAEWFGYFPEATGAAASHYVNGGATYQLSPHVQLDARVGRGVGRVAEDWFMGVGAARRF